MDLKNVYGGSECKWKFKIILNLNYRKIDSKSYAGLEQLKYLRSWDICYLHHEIWNLISSPELSCLNTKLNSRHLIYRKVLVDFVDTD